MACFVIPGMGRTSPFAAKNQVRQHRIHQSLSFFRRFDTMAAFYDKKDG